MGMRIQVRVLYQQSTVLYSAVGRVGLAAIIAAGSGRMNQGWLLVVLQSSIGYSISAVLEL
jgi:hypothetical protein